MGRTAREGSGSRLKNAGAIAADAGGNASAIRRQNLLQHRLWKLNLALALVLFVILAIQWAGSQLGFFAAPTESQAARMEQADLAAILIFGIDLYRGFAKAHDKKMFLRKNWLEILVLIPFGTAFRMFRAFEQLEAVGAMQRVSGIGEIAAVAPEIAEKAKKAGKGALELHNFISNGHVLADFFEGTAKALEPASNAAESVSSLVKGLLK